LASVRFEAVTKVYSRDSKALSEFSLDVEDGEFVVLVGPSGCGKSTTLRVLAGLEEATSGSVFIDNKDITDETPSNRDIAMVFQNYALYPHMTVFDNMAFSLKMRKYSRQEIKRSVVETADILGITEYLDRKPRALSGGQRQRVALGRAIVRHPKVFLFDEPLSNLDAKLRVQMRNELARLHSNLKATMIYVTHDQAEAMTLGDRIVVLKDGVIQQVAPPLEVYNNPANRFVAGFIGSPAMNFYKAEISGDILFAAGNSFRISEVENGRYTLGVRPEDILVSDNGRFILSVEVVETLGNEKVVIGTSPTGESVTARCSPDTDTRPGEHLKFSIDTGRIHLFLTGGEECRL
jgi:multiple sugar transport system ATP-binding protein